MYIRPNPKLRVLYIVMLAPIASCASAVYLTYQTVHSQDHSQLWLNLFLSLLMMCGGIGTWNMSLNFARTFKQFFEACQAVARGELTLRMESSGLSEIQELAVSAKKSNESLDTSLAHWLTASQANHKTFLSLVQAISEAVDARDYYMRGHSGRVTSYSILIAKEMGLPQEQIERIRISALLHDIGKIGIEDSILSKPGILTKEEFEIMKSHPVRGAVLLKAVPEFADVISGVELHHESLDGLGYPYGLKGDEIPIMPRIIAVADTFDAMTTYRPYQDPMDADYVMRILRNLSGTKFDPLAVEALCRSYEAGNIQFPKKKKNVAEQDSVLVSA